MYKLGILGIGNMGGSILDGILKASIYQKDEIFLFDPNKNVQEKYLKEAKNIWIEFDGEEADKKYKKWPVVIFVTLCVFIGSLFMMSGYLAGMAVFGASIRDYTPVGKSGMFQGLRIFSQVLIPGVIGPAIGAAVLKNAETVINNDGTESFLPNENIFNFKNYLLK